MINTMISRPDRQFEIGPTRHYFDGLVLVRDRGGEASGPPVRATPTADPHRKLADPRRKLAHPHRSRADTLPQACRPPRSSADTHRSNEDPHTALNHTWTTRTITKHT